MPYFRFTTGALFRRMHRGDTVGSARLTDQSVALVIMRLALPTGLDPARYAGHSLRSGFLTSTARAWWSWLKDSPRRRTEWIAKAHASVRKPRFVPVMSISHPIGRVLIRVAR
jgi:hypothetical protein